MWPALMEGSTGDTLCVLRLDRRCSPSTPRVRPMPEPMDHRALFLEQLDWIEKVASIACRKAGVWDEDAEDFASWVKMKLIEDDYADIRAFLGQSSLKTYLAT